VSEPYDPKADADLVIAEAGHFKPGYHGGMMTTDFIAAALQLEAAPPGRRLGRLPARHGPAAVGGVEQSVHRGWHLTPAPAAGGREE
jgi:hypothetical protein